MKRKNGTFTDALDAIDVSLTEANCYIQYFADRGEIEADRWRATYARLRAQRAVLKACEGAETALSRGSAKVHIPYLYEGSIHNQRLVKAILRARKVAERRRP
jgi:hypothetical protein